MYKTIHDQFQSFLDQTIEQNITTKEKKEIIKSHLLSHYQKYEEMLLYFFKDEQLNEENYFYITYTYQDLPINMKNDNEFVVSFLYDLDNKMYFELVVFNENYYGNETSEILYCYN